MNTFDFGDLYTGKLVRLAAPQAEDKDILAHWSNDDEYMRTLRRGPAVPKPASAYDEKNQHSHDDFNFHIRTLAEDRLIGTGGIGVSWNNHAGWLWIGIGEAEYRERGYGTDAVRLFVNYAFRELGLYRFGLAVFAYNTRAIHVFEKIGFVHEGVLRCALYRDGQRYDELSMSILRPEWEKIVAQERAPQQP